MTKTDSPILTLIIQQFRLLKEEAPILDAPSMLLTKLILARI